jgi:hypothetical protein
MTKLENENYGIGDWGYTYAGKGSTYTHWQQFGANKSDASSECTNTRVPMFGVQTVKNRDLAAPQPNLSVCTDRKIVILYV